MSLKKANCKKQGLEVKIPKNLDTRMHAEAYFREACTHASEAANPLDAEKTRGHVVQKRFGAST